MKLKFAAAFCLSLAAGIASAQAPAPPRPGPEHEILKGDVGTWDATVESFMTGGPTPMVSKGTETNVLVGGLWLVTDFKADMMGMPFLGHGISGYDPHKKKYVGTWVDTMSSGLGISESTWDAATKTMTGTHEGPDPSGQLQKMKAVVVYKDPDTRVFTMSGAGPDGKDVKFLTITYQRRK
jgi:hypothetical protein